MRKVSGIRTLLVVFLLFTILIVVNSSELFNGNSDNNFLTINKTDVQAGTFVASPVSVEGVVSVFSDNLEQITTLHLYDNEVFSDTFMIKTDAEAIISTYLISGTSLRVTEAVYTSFEVVMIIANVANSIDESRGEWLHFCSLFKQVSFT